MMRSSGYNRFGVLMATSWPAFCPRLHRLQGDFSSMITLILLQRAFCATAIFHFPVLKADVMGRAVEPQAAYRRVSHEAIKDPIGPFIDIKPRWIAIEDHRLI